MSPPVPPSTHAWIVFPLLVLGFLLWSHTAHRARIEYVTSAVSGAAVVAAGSPTGYAGGIRELVGPEQNKDSAHWIAQTQQMFVRGEWRVRQIDYENAPFGREVLAPSPYRWWLGFVAQCDHFLAGRPAGLSVERAALYADPLWQALLLVTAVAFTAWRFGPWSATLLSLGLVALFPLATGFFPGLPDDKTLSRTFAFASVLLLLAGLRSPRGPARWFFLAGVAGGFGLWVSVTETVPVVLGIAVGAGLVLWIGRRNKLAGTTGWPAPGHWLGWALGGASSSLLFYLVEYFPAHLGSWRLQVNHPLYSLAWLGLGAALSQAAAWNREEVPGGNKRRVGVLFLALAVIAPLPALMWQGSNPGFLTVDLWSFRLTRLANSPEAAHLWAWVIRDGLSLTVWSTLLPLLMVLPAGWLLLRKDTSSAARAALAIALGPVLVGMGFACWHLGRWSSVDAVLLALLIAITVSLRDNPWHSFALKRWTGCLALLLLPGLYQLWPPTKEPKDIPLDEVELSGLIARDLAHWLAKRAEPGRAVVLAPPNDTSALYYYGGLRGVGTLSWENQAGIGASVRIFSATSPAEALALIERRGITHIVIPSWDRYLSEFVRIGVGQEDASFLGGLRNWALPAWLRPVAYELPAVPGYEGQSVAVFAVVEEQDEATSLSRLAEYFTEMGQMNFAAQVSQSLQRFPVDLGAVIARAQVAMARREGTGFTEALNTVTARLAAGADRNLPWDRRVGLAVVLAQGGKMDLAREQVRRCLDETNEIKLRSVSTSSLYRLLVLAKRFELDLADARLRELARGLLPAEWRARLSS